LDDVYPPGAWNLPVNPALSAPRRVTPIAERRNTTSYRDYYGPNIQAEIPIPDAPERLVIVNKAFAHALCDVMLLVGRDGEVCKSVADAPGPVLATLLRSAALFVRFLSEPDNVQAFDMDGGQVIIGWNYDETVDRENGQYFDKRMHWHLNGFAPAVRRSAVPVPLREVASVSMRRMLVDPVGYLAQEVMADALRPIGLPDECELLPVDPSSDAANGLPVGLKIRIPRWDYLESDACGILLRGLHHAAARTYETVYRAFTGMPVEPLVAWHRRPLLSVHDVEARLRQLSWLGETTKQRLMGLRHVLRDVSDREMRLLRTRTDVANRCLTLGGLSYNLAFYTPHPVKADEPLFKAGELYVVMQLKVISSLGQAPAVGGAVASKLDRSSGPAMTDQEQARRTEFQQQYINTLRRELS
jgi:hypothetical protein